MLRTSAFRVARSAFATKQLPKIALRSIVSIEEAKKMPKFHCDMPNDVILNMAIAGDQDAREERLIREIMSVDNIDHKSAVAVLEKITESNRKGLFIITLPYKIGIASAVGVAFLTVPLIYHLESVMWFNEGYVTSDVPEEKDLETPLEVSSWAWNWMEPSLGTASFVLLCFQYARNQLQNLDAKPYTSMILHRRARRVASEFPQYNKNIVMQFSEGDSLSP